MEKFYKVTPESLQKYEKSFYIFEPQLVACYDYNYGKISNAKSIQYFVKPKSYLYPIDLNKGFKNYVRRESFMYSRNINISLKYDMSFNICDIEKTKVITRRGTLVSIMELFYNNHVLDDLIIKVTRYNEVLYMVREEQDESKVLLTPSKTHHGHLNDIVFSDAPGKIPNINKSHDENIEQVGVHRSIFGKYDIIYSGEISGITSNNKVEDFENLDALNDEQFVFAKQMWEHLKYNENKYLVYWLQSYLANVKEIYFGYKNRNGIINEPLKHMLVEDLPKNRYWKSSICTGFLYDFLQNVEKLMSNVNCLNTVYVFRYNIGQRSFEYEAFNDKNDKTFISKEYMEYCKMSNN